MTALTYWWDDKHYNLVYYKSTDELAFEKFKDLSSSTNNIKFDDLVFKRNRNVLIIYRVNGMTFFEERNINKGRANNNCMLIEFI